MTDLVQKIADAVDAAWGAWSDDANDERPFIVVLREAIRQALAQSGEAVEYTFGRGEKVVNWGDYNGRPAVFIAPAKQPGLVGECANREAIPRNELVTGEIVLTFPTEEHARLVEASLFNRERHPAPSADRVAELETQLVAEYGLSERWRQRTLAAEKQLAESEKKREAVTSDWSKLGAKLGLLQMQLGATERQLAESRERRGRMREALRNLLQETHEPSCYHVHHAKRDQHEYIEACPVIQRHRVAVGRAVAALAADKEKK